MPVKRDKNGRFAANGGRARDKARAASKTRKSNAAKPLSSLSQSDKSLASAAAAAKKKPSRKDARAAALKNAQAKLLAAANKRK